MRSPAEPGNEAEDSEMACLARLDRDAIQTVGQRHLDRLHALNSTAVRVVDKMPDNYMYVGMLAALFPRARFIHCRRDLRDVAVSCWMTNFRQIRWANDLDHIASRFHEYQRLIEHWKTTLPVPLLPIDYEETVADFESVARRLISWCGLEWEPACLEFHQTAASGAHGQRHAGTAADLHALGGALEALRAGAGRPVRATRSEFQLWRRPVMKFAWLAADTTEEAARVQLAVFRRMTPERRVELALAMTADLRRRLAEGVRQRHPEYSEDQVRLAVIRLTLGDDLFRTVYPGVDVRG